MTVIFLDFDGVLNNQGSFIYEDRLRKNGTRKGPVSETFDPVCASNFQWVLDHYPEMKVVISSTWREHFDLPWLKAKLTEYGIDSERVIGVTPRIMQSMRGIEIQEWLKAHPEVTRFVIIDDNDWHISKLFKKNFVQTSWETGLTFSHAVQVLDTFMELKQEEKIKRREEKADAKTE